MKFGHADHDELDSLVFALPDDHQNSVLSTSPGDPVANFKVFTGCGKWGIPAWVGNLYPEKTKSKDFLSVYLKRFNSVELNGTFYRLSRKSISEWAEAAKGTDFMFCPKWSRRVSHLKRLNEVEESTQYFIDACADFGDNLGTTFLTLPPNFAPKYLERVETFVKLIPQGFPVHIELRHPDWFKEPHFSQTCELLESHGIGLVITDVALRRDVLHQRLTTREVFIRFNGYGLHPTDYARISAWTERLSKWKASGLREVYFFCHQANELHTPHCCVHFLRSMEQSCGLNLDIPDLPALEE